MNPHIERRGVKLLRWKKWFPRTYLSGFITARQTPPPPMDEEDYDVVTQEDSWAVIRYVAACWRHRAVLI